MTNLTASPQNSFLDRNRAPGITVARVLLAGILLLSIALHFVNLSAIGDANTYYTAAAQSMLQSWHNFFFVAAEPGGSVTVDKPPLGLWIEAAFALFLGLSGVTVSLPNILAGILSVPLLYHLVKKYLGALAGLVAALVLVITPIALATDRNNTIDGMLVFVLLLAAWAFVQATESGKARWLFLGALLVGLGFNIKMLQVFLPLPAFYALYFLGAQTGWQRKLLNLGLATLLLLIVSLSWAVAVDLVPPDQRPYIGSSENNTVTELIVGHNGLSRLFNPRAGNTAPAQNNGAPAHPTVQPRANAPSGPQPPNGAPPGRPQPPPPGAFGDGPNVSPSMNPGSAGGTPFSQETGIPGIARFFIAPLSKQMSWVLPFALLSIALLAFAARLRVPLAPVHRALVLWGGWLLTCLVFLSAVEGIFHAYYTIMLAPALGAVVGLGAAQLWRWQARPPRVNWLLICAAALTALFQVFTARQYDVTALWIYLPLLPLIGGAALLWSKPLRRVGFVAVLASMLLIPGIWTGLTVLDKAPNVSLPTAYDGKTTPNAMGRPTPTNPRAAGDEALLAYLQAHTQDVTYLVAVPSAQIGAPLVLETGRPVLYMGGFSGGDPVVDSAGLADMVAQGELRYVLLSGENNKPELARWLAASCATVPEFSRASNPVEQSPQQPHNPGIPNPPNAPAATTLYQCGE